MRFATGNRQNYAVEFHILHNEGLTKFVGDFLRKLHIDADKFVAFFIFEGRKCCIGCHNEFIFLFFIFAADQRDAGCDGDYNNQKCNQNLFHNSISFPFQVMGTLYHLTMNNASVLCKYFLNFKNFIQQHL